MDTRRSTPSKASISRRRLFQAGTVIAGAMSSEQAAAAATYGPNASTSGKAVHQTDQPMLMRAVLVLFAVMAAPTAHRPMRNDLHYDFSASRIVTAASRMAVTNSIFRLEPIHAVRAGQQVFFQGTQF